MGLNIIQFQKIFSVVTRWILVFAFLLQTGCTGCFNKSPHASFTPSTTEGEAPLVVVFDASSSTDDKGIDNYSWQFGDNHQDSGEFVTYTFNEPGTYISTLTVTDANGKSSSFSQEIVVQAQSVNLPPQAEFEWNIDTSATSAVVSFDASGCSDPDGEITEYHWDFGDGQSGDGVRQTHEYTVSDVYLVALTVIDDKGETHSVQHDIGISLLVEDLPPDPSEVAPKFDTTVSTEFATETEFLYTGDDPIQTGVAPDTINRERVAILRGVVLDKENNPLPGVTITILNHPEFGQTLSRADGIFDIAVNGGGQLTINYAKEDYLPVQRQLETPWQDFMWAPDVVLMQLDPVVTTIDLSNQTEELAVARGSVVTDEDGTRQATLLIPSEIETEMILPDGSRQPLTSVSIRATEYTVGENGSEAMPAELPPNSGYTYAVELSVDEAAEANATDVQFNEPLYYYVEDFIGFPVGSPVPAGYYDEEQGKWVASENGRVIEILTIRNGMAEIDTTGDGEADNVDIADAEREKLASLYPDAPQRLWRIPIRHFTSWDFNWPFGPPPDAESPDQQSPFGDNSERGDGLSNGNGSRSQGGCKTAGSIIECHNQVLGEELPIVGTPFTLNYRSNRVEGRKAAYTLNIPLSGDSVPDSLSGIALEITVGGNKYDMGVLPAERNQTYTFEWDGTTAYSGGEKAQGTRPIFVRIGYVYPAVYRSAIGTQSFANSGASLLEFVEARDEFIFWQEWQGTIGTWNIQENGLGGWSLDANHVYDTSGHIVFAGNGEQYGMSNAATSVSAYVGNQARANYYGHELPENNAPINRLFGAKLSSGPDGSLYIPNNTHILKVDTNGNVTTVVGSLSSSQGYGGDGGPATEAVLNQALSVALSPDGSLFIADANNHRLRKVDPMGVITTFAGTGSAGFSGDNGPALLAQFAYPTSVAVGPDGNVYVADKNNHRIRRVGTDGIITTYAGTGIGCGIAIEDNQLAVEAPLCSPMSLQVDSDGNLYFINSGRLNIRTVYRIGQDGLITAVAGKVDSEGYNGDGLLATEAELKRPEDIALGPDGTLYIADSENHRIRYVTSDGIIATLAGTSYPWCKRYGGLPTKMCVTHPRSLAVGLDGAVYYSAIGLYGYSDGNYAYDYIFKIARSIPQFGENEIVIPADSNDILYVFDKTGRHLRTVDALTGLTLYSFAYEDGLLVAIEDIDGNVTTIERIKRNDENIIVIKGPYGQQTELELDNGYINRITNPDGEQISLTYHDELAGLLTSMTSPRGYTWHYAYDDSGRLVRDDQPTEVGGFKELNREDSFDGYVATLSTAMAYETTYEVAQYSTGERSWTNTFPGNIEHEVVFNTDGSQMTQYADGMVATEQKSPGPRFGMLAPVANGTLSTPGGLTYTYTTNRTETLADDADLLSVETQTDTVTVNERVYTSVYEEAQGQFTFSTPEGRQAVATLDEKGRVVSEQVAGLAPVFYDYDDRGRLTTITLGTGEEARPYTIAYDANGYVENITDPLQRQVAFTYDEAGRIISQELPGSRTIGYGYDADGNVTSITPPGKPEHNFSYSAIGLNTAYAPPAVVGDGSNQTTYEYNSDGQLTQANRPDDATIGIEYNAAGWPTTVAIPRGDIQYTYEPNSGNLAEITAPDGGELSFTYDGALPTSVTWDGTINGTVAAAYDNNFQVTSLSVNGENPVAYQYDDDGLLMQAGELSLMHDDLTGLLTGTTLDNVADTYTYNDFGELTGYRAAYGENDLFNVAYEYDALGRIVAKTETVDGVTTRYDYGYDEAGRLWQVQENGIVGDTYTYDDNGNRLSYTDAVGEAITADYDNQDRLLRYGDLTFTYTANGELLTKTNTSNDETTHYDYDVLGNLIGVSLPDGAEIEYLIDGLNRRIGKKLNGELVQSFLYQDGLNPVAELDGEGNIVARFVYGSRINVPDYIIKNGNTYRVITDHLGSVRFVTQVSSGSFIQQIDYDAWGHALEDTNSRFQPFGFAGGIYDHDTKFLQYGYRDYVPQFGRWIARDPIGFYSEDVNLYTYASNNPTNLIDPSGLEPVYRIPNDRIQELLRKLRFSEKEQAKFIDTYLNKIYPGGGCQGHVLRKARERRRPIMVAFFDYIYSKDVERFHANEINLIEDKLMTLPSVNDDNFSYKVKADFWERLWEKYSKHMGQSSQRSFAGFE